MAYSVDYRQAAGIVRIVLADDVSRQELEAARSESSGLLTEHGSHRLFVDASKEKQRQPILEDFEFTKRLREAYGPKVRIAVLVDADDESYMRYVEDVARNRGVNMSLFIDKQAALDWL